MSRSSLSKSEDWPDPKGYPKSIRIHFSVYVGAVILLLMVVTGVIVSEKHASSMTEAVVERLVTQARSYSNSASKLFVTAEAPDALMLNNICRKLSDDSDDIFWAAVADSGKHLIAHTDVRQVASVGSLPVWRSTREWESLRDGETYTISGDTVRINVPIREHGLIVGQLELAASAEPIRSSRFQSLITMGSIALAVLLLGLPLTLVMTHRKLRPLTVITEHLRGMDPNEPRVDIPISTMNEFGYLADTLRVMGSKVTEAKAQSIERERMAKELEIAREIQGNILPKRFPGNNAIETAGFYQSAKEVGGDYYDFIELDENRFGFLVADVSGKSLPGMLVMLLTRDIVRQTSRQITDPAELLRQVNRELRPSIRRGMFVTMFFGILDLRTGRCDFASAGHNPLLHLSSADGTVQQHKPGGFPLGLIASEQFDKEIRTESLMLRENDVLIQYTDGINEAQNRDRDEYGMERFISSLGQNQNRPTQEIVESTMDELRSFVGSADQYDDITLVAVKWCQSIAKPDSGDTNERRSACKDEVF